MKLTDRDIALTLLRGGRIRRKYWKGYLTTGGCDSEVVYNGDVPYFLDVDDLMADDWRIVK